MNLIAGPRSIIQFLCDVESILVKSTSLNNIIESRPSIQCISVTEVLDCVNNNLLLTLIHGPPLNNAGISLRSLATSAMDDNSVFKNRCFSKYIFPFLSLLYRLVRGVDSHGINLFPHYATSSSGRINNTPDLKFQDLSKTAFCLMQTIPLVIIQATLRQGMRTVGDLWVWHGPRQTFKLSVQRPILHFKPLVKTRLVLHLRMLIHW